MPFDGIITKKIINDLNKSIIGGKVNKISVPNKNEIILSIYSQGKNKNLLINISSQYYRMHLTNYLKANPFNPINFCMVLRKHLIGYTIKNIYTHGLDRVITIEFEGYNELNDITYKKLFIELMGKYSNVVLTNQNNVIIDSFKHFNSFENNIREILPAHEYVMVDNSKKDIFKTSQNEFVQDIQLSTISKSISNTYTGISNTFVENQLQYLSQNENMLSSLYTNILQICNNLSNCSIIPYKNDYTICYTNSESDDSNTFLDMFYNKKEEMDLLLSYRSNLLKLVLANLNRITKKLNNIHIKQNECDNMDIFRIYGELLTANLYKLPSYFRESSVILDNFYDNNNPISIPLDTAFSPSENAKRYFKKYHKLKNASEIIEKQKQEFSLLLDYLQSIVFELENAETIKDIDEIYEEVIESQVLKNIDSSSQLKVSNNSKVKKIVNKKSSSKNSNAKIEPLTFLVDNFTFLVGKNNKQNDYITTRVGKNEDIWFHTKDFHGSHGILKCNGMAETVSQNTIISCAKIVVSHSKAKHSSNVPVDYCFVKYVKKPSNSKPGMVIYSHNKTVYV